MLSIKYCVTEYAILNICTYSNDHQLAWKLSDKLTSLAQGQIYVTGFAKKGLIRAIINI